MILLLNIAWSVLVSIIPKRGGIMLGPPCRLVRVPRPGVRRLGLSQGGLQCSHRKQPAPTKQEIVGTGSGFAMTSRIRQIDKGIRYSDGMGQR